MVVSVLLFAELRTLGARYELEATVAVRRAHLNGTSVSPRYTLRWSPLADDPEISAAGLVVLLGSTD